MHLPILQGRLFTWTEKDSQRSPEHDPSDVDVLILQVHPIKVQPIKILLDVKHTLGIHIQPHGMLFQEKRKTQGLPYQLPPFESWV